MKARAAGPTEDDRDFAHGGWSVNLWDDHRNAGIGGSTNS